MAEASRNWTSLYHSLDSILSFLKTDKYSQVEQVQSLLHVFSQHYNEDLSPSPQHLHPFIALEGLDGSGKTYLLKKLGNKIGAEKKSTPPNCVLHLRPWFDQQPKELRRAYYSLGNYIVGQEIEKLVQRCPVLIDRFWNSTAAYAIADERTELPPAGDPVYEWPTDLIKPDVVLFLSLTELRRLERISGRSTNTTEEQNIAEDLRWRNSILQAYKRMSNVNMKIVDANKYVNKVVAETYGIVQPFL